MTDFQQKNDSPVNDDIPCSSIAADEEVPCTSSNSNFHAKLSDHAMASVIAETITTADEITLETPKKLNVDVESLRSSDYHPLYNLSDNSFYSEIGSFDAKPLAGKIANFITQCLNAKMSFKKQRHLLVCVSVQPLRELTRDFATLSL